MVLIEITCLTLLWTVFPLTLYHVRVAQGSEAVAFTPRAARSGDSEEIADCLHDIRILVWGWVEQII